MLILNINHNSSSLYHSQFTVQNRMLLFYGYINSKKLYFYFFHGKV